MTNCWRSSRSRRPGCWFDDKFGAEALLRQGHEDDALAYAEALLEGDRQTWGHHDICRFCETILVRQGKADEAYRRFGLPTASGKQHWAGDVARSGQTATLTGMPRALLEDLIAHPRAARANGFAAAKTATYFDIALDCAADHEAAPRDAHPGRPRFRDQGTGFCCRCRSACHQAIFWRAWL